MVIHEHYATQVHEFGAETLFCSCGASFYWRNPVSAELSMREWKAGLDKARREGYERMINHLAPDKSEE